MDTADITNKEPEKTQEIQVAVEKTMPCWFEFKTIMQNPITRKWEDGICVHNICENAIESFKQVFIKEESTPVIVTKISFKDGGWIYVKKEPVKLLKKLELETFKM